MKTISYTKLRTGEWGIRGAGLTAGAKVTVVKKSGEIREEIVAKVVWTGSDGTCLATVVPPERPARPPAPPAPARRTGRTYECEECGDRVEPGSRCWETGMVH